MIKEFIGGIPCNGRQEDTESILWAALLKASGMRDLDKPITDAQFNGEFFTSPLKANKAAQGVIQLNSFNRHMAIGLSLAAAADKPPYLVLNAYEEWIEFVLYNKCRACKDTDGRCVVAPPIFWMASYAGAENVPVEYALTRFLNKPYLLVGSIFKPKGIQLHLIGVGVFAMIYYYGSRAKLPSSLKLAAKILYKRQPKNAFFAWLAGQDDDACELVEKVKDYIAARGQGNRHQWAWEKEDAEQAWRHSCGWDVEFIDNLLELEM